MWCRWSDFSTWVVRSGQTTRVFSRLIQPREVGEGEWWRSAAGDEWVGNRWSPSLACDAWRVGQKPDGGRWCLQEEEDSDFGAVSYTHLTLPTKRIV